MTVLKLLEKSKENVDSIGSAALAEEIDMMSLTQVCARMSGSFETAISKARNCDRFENEVDAMVEFLNEEWLISVSNLDYDPFDKWTEQMKESYARWLMAPAKKGSS